MAYTGIKNLRPCEYKFTDEDRAKAAASRKANYERRKTLGEIMAAWGNSEANEESKKKFKALGLDDVTINKALLLIPLLKNATQGDVKSIELIIKLMGDDMKYIAEVEKLRAETNLINGSTGLEKIEVSMDVKRSDTDR